SPTPASQNRLRGRQRPTQRRLSVDRGLDNAIYGMGVEAGLADSALRNLAFPIITSSASWAKKGKRDKLAGLPEDVVARVERVQPFSTLDPLPLTYLADLVNSDKHRAGFTLELVPLLPDRESKIWDLETEMHPADAEQAIAALNADEQVSIDLGPIWDRKVVARMRLPSGTGPQVRVKNVNFPVTLAVEAGRETRSLPVVPTMERVFDYVTSAVRYIVGDDAHPPGAYTFR
ncbi:hypothetical protein, partial [uncultured Serinicoccus sp.]|uniref:hypothetical protein n=1 Tax=uncultured Serinicoccus sp. TaxID=735514 RepID=UPI00261DA6A0